MPTLHETFYDRASADRAVGDLIANGISASDISIVMAGATKDKLFPDAEEQQLDAGIARGGAVGSVAGVCGGLLLGGALLVATDGLAAPLFATGPIAAALAGGVSGIAVGTLAGALTGAGVAEHDASAVEKSVNDGAVVVAVKVTPETEHDVDEIFRHDNRGIEPTP